MNASRIKAITKLLLLFGLPLAFIVGLFSWGVHFGHSHRRAILAFERDWLGMEVEVPPEPPPDEPTSKESDASDPNEGEQKTKGEQKSDESKDAAQPKPKEDAPQPSEDEKPSAPIGTPPDQPEPEPEAPAGPASEVEPSAKADALDGALADRLAMPVKIRVEVLVGPDVAQDEGAWIDYVQRNVSLASMIYREQFGIELELVGVRRWQVAPAGMDLEALLSDLRARDHDGADVLLGFTGQPLEAGVETATRPEADDPFNGGVAVVPAWPEHDNAHLRSTLRAMATLFGAQLVTDPEDPAYQGASWMSDAPVRESRPAWIDAENRRRVLERKDRPFQVEQED